MTTMPIIEIAEFELRDGVDPAQFARVDAEVGRQHVSKQPGFLSRETAQGETAWIVVVHWADAASADRSMATYAQAPAAAEQLALMKPGTSTMTRYDVVTS